MTGLRVLQIAVAVVLAGCASFAQSIISAQSGLVHYYEGEVSLDNKLVETKSGEFPQMKANQVIETRLGRVELTLTPGVVVRLGENSALRMISPRLEDTRLEFVRGSAIIEIVEPMRSDQLTFLYKGAELPMERDGLYRLDSEPARFQAYQGQAVVRQAGQSYTVRSGRMLDFTTLLVEKFDSKKGDALYRWAKRRSGELAVANISSARSMGGSSGRSGWMYNPYFGMLTFVPASGRLYSPFGWAFWSPYSVNQFYYSYMNNYMPIYRPGGSGSGNVNASGWSGSSVRPSYQSNRDAGIFHGPATREPSAGWSAPPSSGGSSGGSAPSAVSSSRGSDSGSRVSGGGGGHAGGGGGRGGH
ncbi:MAG: hypothetical protein NTY38_04325 [Acidobacteria bacterium]|nr:hypothetical protein [Acidobacteriota bacterium]